MEKSIDDCFKNDGNSPCNDTVTIFDEFFKARRSKTTRTLKLGQNLKPDPRLTNE